MADIKHLFHISASFEKVYHAISTIEGLAAWWTVQTTGKSEVGGMIEFRFGSQFFNKMRVIEMKPGSSVTWECVEGPPDWIGTKISFHLDENEGKTRVRFDHTGWKDANDFYANCNFSWGRFMESLRGLCEKGKGNPFSAS
ncbi:MAG TPA: SRPBCC domain-containing protein [Bacteroidia bacterium]|jgi:uncharacterized protein YndB with AHSA1/START domain|nr:SRPBCC domain-containing protein [Bacteroidia bacterium]